MDREIQAHLEQFLTASKQKIIPFKVSLTKDLKFGNFSTNLSFVYAKVNHVDPKVIADEVINHLRTNHADFYERIEFVPPGFINFWLKKQLNTALIDQILQERETFPLLKKQTEKISIEYVSANPTGKLHLAHAYAAIFGTALVRIWKKLGFEVETEFYINDAGNQIDKLALSVLIRYLNLFNVTQELFDDCYHGIEIIDCAKALKNEYNDQFLKTSFNANAILDPKANEVIKEFAKNFMLEQIKTDLKLINVTFDRWTSEKSLYKSNQVQNVLNALKQTSYTYEKDHALWLKTTTFGDDKDRVLVKSDGLLTYLVPDIALHVQKLNRDFDEFFNIWGMDHHGYIPRLKIALQMLGYKKPIEIICIQVMKLEKNHEEFKLSKRSGNSLTLEELIQHIGKDELTWICTSSQTSSHKTFEVTKILVHDNTNPLFYVEYAYARIQSILKKQTYDMQVAYSNENISPKLSKLINELANYETVLWNVKKFKETQGLNNYLYQLATMFHEFYNEINILNLQNVELKNTYLKAIAAVAIVLKNGLNLLGIDAYDQM